MYTFFRVSPHHDFLLFHLHFHLLFTSLLFSSLLFSPLFFSPLFSFLSSLSSFSVFFLCLCLRVLVACVSPCVFVWCGVVCAVWCGTLKTPCVDSKRPRVCRYTRGRFESTHGKRFESTHGGHRQLCLPKNCPRRAVTWPHRFTESNHWMLPMFKFEKRSRTTCSRFLQSFASPDEAVKVQLSWGSVGGSQP